ncbi:unnamed protein product, partial [Sphacelaria rigidula]
MPLFGLCSGKAGYNRREFSFLKYFSFFEISFKRGLPPQRPALCLTKKQFCTHRSPDLHIGSEMRRFWKWSFVQQLCSVQTRRNKATRHPHTHPRKSAHRHPLLT